MGFGGMSLGSLLLILLIVLVLFGTKKLRNIGSDLGSAVKGFKQAMGEGEASAEKDEPAHLEQHPSEKAKDTEHSVNDRHA